MIDKFVIININFNYIQNLWKVIKILVLILKLLIATLSAAVLHDTVEDTATTY